MILLTYLSCFQNEKAVSPQIDPENEEISELLLLEQSDLQHFDCRNLRYTSVQNRCMELKKRPHLWATTKSQTISQDVATKQRSTTTHPIPVIPKPIIKDFSISHRDCKDANCWEEQAKKAQTQEEVFGICTKIQHQKWQQECFFSTAEFMFEKKTLPYADAVSLCLQAPMFVSDCLRHLTFVIAQSVPPSTSNQESDWKIWKQHLQTLQNFWKDRDPIFLEHHIDLLISKSMDISYERGGIVAGNLLDYIDIKYHHHIYASASYYLLLWEGATSFDLAGWESRIFRALDYRLTPKDQRNPRSYVNIKSPKNWANNQNTTEAQYAAIMYRTDGRRLFVPFQSENLSQSKEIQRINMRICIVEAAARVPNGQNILREGLQDTSDFVQKTAQRHLEK